MATNTESKVMIMGLDNSGKTSIILSLKKDANLLNYFSIDNAKALKPTQGLNILNVDDGFSKYNVWDFGGQEIYRSGYLEKIEEYVIGVNRIIFVIDVQDADRYELALQYLTQIIQKLKGKHSGIEFAVFLHKYDPILEMRTTFNKKVDQDLIKKIKHSIPKEFPYKIYKTSIYTIFKKDIVP